MASLGMDIPFLQSHRPPPPPPAQSDSPVHIESLSTPYESTFELIPIHQFDLSLVISGLTPAFLDTIDEPTEEAKDKCRLFL